MKSLIILYCVLLVGCTQYTGSKIPMDYINLATGEHTTCQTFIRVDNTNMSWFVCECPNDEIPTLRRLEKHT